MDVVRDTLDERILRYLQEHIPAIQQELRAHLRVPREVLERRLKALERKRLIEREPIPGRTYIRLLRADIGFIGVRKTQKRAYRRQKPPKGPPRVESDPGPMYQ
ncbi:MAG: hypothetical protein HY558_01070 [Euryarchaeota archaeon]|nr:hypothetical protein [Euryarchaeota archaeon]